MQQQLEKYAELVLKKGVNIQPKQQLVLNAPIEARDFVKALYKKAYQLNSGRVHVFWSDETLSPIFYEYASDEVIEGYSKPRIEMMEKLIDEKAALLSISASDPTLLKNSDQEKIAKARKASQIASKNIMTSVTSGKIRWNIVSVPTPAWAKKVFPEVSEQEAVSKLWEYIFKATRVDQEDPVAAWNSHVNRLNEKRDYLNEKKFDKLIYKAPGTNLEVKLPVGHLWVAGAKDDEDGYAFIPNIPTEEVFTMNQKDGINGTLRSTMPLNYSGSLIENMEFTFKEGKVVDFNATQGKEVLAKILETDEGASYLGEVALVPFNSPISNLKTIFFNTLFDENASCHFALGRAYPYTLEGGTKLSPEELAKKGANFSLTHVDFMVGSKELDIDGVTESGETLPIFKNGDWAF